jgi:drug/metabolite transporter (DMT)-like permease
MIAALRPWVQWLLWTTPFTAFVSGRNFRRHWIEKFSYAYFVFGVICVSLAWQHPNDPAPQVALFSYALPFVAIDIKRFHSQLRRPAVAIAATLLLA